MKNKRVEEWNRLRKKLKIEYKNRGITTCEVGLEKCMRDFGLSFAHRHKRVYYYQRPELLGSFNETILACAYCHQEIEKDRELTEMVFKKLRD